MQALRHWRLAKRQNLAMLRHGQTSVEFALVAPFIFVMFFGLLELMTYNTANHAANHAAYEAAREGTLPGATPAKCVARARHLVGRLGYDTVEVTVTPSDLSDADSVNVVVSIDANEIGLGSGFFLQDARLESAVQIRRNLN